MTKQEVQQTRDKFRARHAAVDLIAFHLSLWHTRPYNPDEAEELLDTMQMFGNDEDAEHAVDVCNVRSVEFYR